MYYQGTQRNFGECIRVLQKNRTNKYVYVYVFIIYVFLCEHIFIYFICLLQEVLPYYSKFDSGMVLKDSGEGKASQQIHFGQSDSVLWRSTLTTELWVIDSLAGQETWVVKTRNLVTRKSGKEVHEWKLQDELHVKIPWYHGHSHLGHPLQRHQVGVLDNQADEMISLSCECHSTHFLCHPSAFLVSMLALTRANRYHLH